VLKCNHWIRNTDQISYSSLSNWVVEANSFSPSTEFTSSHLPWKPGTQETPRLIDILIQRNFVVSNWMLSGDSYSSLSFRNTRNTCSSCCRPRCQDIRRSPSSHWLWSSTHHWFWTARHQLRAVISPNLHKQIFQLVWIDGWTCPVAQPLASEWRETRKASGTRFHFAPMINWQARLYALPCNRPQCQVQVM